MSNKKRVAFGQFENDLQETMKGVKVRPVPTSKDYLKWIEEWIIELANSSTPWDRNGTIQLQDIDRGFFKDNKKYTRQIGDLLVKHQFLDVSVAIWDHCHNTDVEKENYLNVPAYKLMKEILWNYSDLCENFCIDAFHQEKAVERCMKEFLLKENAVKNLKSEESQYFVKATLIFLHNILCLCNDNRILVRRNSGIQRILEYHQSDSPMIKAQAMLVLAYCVNEDENNKIIADSGVISFIIELQKTAMDSPGHSTETYSFTVKEILMGLSKLALNDNNKVSIVKAGILPLLTVSLGDEFSIEEHAVALECLWTLSFHEKNKAQIEEEPGLLEAVRRFAKNAGSDEKIYRSCEGIVFNVEGRYPTSYSEIGIKDDNKPHIMLSYQWDVQETILELRTKLQESGHKVWLDVDNMKGSILSAIAEAIENASVVVIAMTEKYKNSNACRTEAEYTYKQSKPIIPLLLEPKYKADGWLGALLGMQLYFDITGEDWKETKYDSLLRHIDLKIEVESEIKEKSITAVDSPDQVSAQNENLLRNWTRKEVKKWADVSGIGDLLPVSLFDGQLLEGLSKMLKRSPDVYYKRVQTELKLNLVQMLRLTNSLESL